jgi:molybdopterin converting factor small subunit
VSPDGHRRPDPDDPAHLHRRRQGRDGDGATLSALIDDLDGNHPGIKDRLIDNGDLRRFVNVYVNDEDVRFIGGLDAQLADGDQVVVLPAVAGG